MKVFIKALSEALNAEGVSGRATWRAANLIGALTGFFIMFCGLYRMELTYIRVGIAYMLLSCVLALFADESRFEN